MDAGSLPDWNDYLARLGEADGLLELLADPNDPALRQAAYRLFFLGLAGGYLTTFADPNCPDFVPPVNTAFNASGTNPDFAYLQAAISGEGTYRFSGWRGEGLFVHGDIMAGSLGVMDEPGPSLCAFDLDEMRLGPDGAFDILISAERPAGHDGDWLPLDPKARAIVVRQASYDWGGHRDGRFAIERVDGPLRPPIFSAEEVARRLDRLAGHARRYAGRWLAHMKGQREKGLFNRFERDDWAGRGGAAGQVYYQGLFRIEPGQALILETELPEYALYWNVQLSDRLWNTIDWVNRQSSLNGGQARIDSDGRFRAVIALEDPGVPNWLDPGGEREGSIMLRWMRCSSGPEPSLTPVPLTELRSRLPADTPAVSAEARDQSLRARRRGAQLRRRW